MERRRDDRQLHAGAAIRRSVCAAALRLCVDLPDRFFTFEAPNGKSHAAAERPPVGVSPRLHVPEGRGTLVPPYGRHDGMAMPLGRPNMPLNAANCLTGGCSTTPRRLSALYGHPRVRQCTTHSLLACRSRVGASLPVAVGPACVGLTRALMPITVPGRCHCPSGHPKAMLVVLTCLHSFETAHSSSTRTGCVASQGNRYQLERSPCLSPAL